MISPSSVLRPHRQISRRLILRVAQFLNGSQYLLPCLRPRSARPVEHVRNRGDRYARPVGDIFDAYSHSLLFPQPSQPL